MGFSSFQLWFHWFNFTAGWDGKRVAVHTWQSTCKYWMSLRSVRYEWWRAGSSGTLEGIGYSASGTWMEVTDSFDDKKGVQIIIIRIAEHVDGGSRRLLVIYFFHPSKPSPPTPSLSKGNVGAFHIHSPGSSSLTANARKYKPPFECFSLSWMSVIITLAF